VMEPTDHNRRAWDEVHRRRTEVTAGQLGLPQPVRRALADLHGKRVLNLQCGTGESAAELAELGAIVTGVDISAEAIAIARERWPSILWIEADVHSLPRELRRGRFDLVYTGDGVLVWLHDLDAWAQGIASALRSGGDFLLHEEHPVAVCVDGLMHWRESYFEESVFVGVGWSHFDVPGPPAREEKRERFWRLGQVVNAVVRAGLHVRALEEYPQQPGNYRHQDGRVPGAFLLHAQRP
jgi:SAM-dependent methyltransferase